MANISSASLTKISNFQHLKFRNKLSLQKALLNHGPMSVSVNVSPKSFKFYSSGVYYDEECGMYWKTKIDLINNQAVVCVFANSVLLALINMC